MAINFPSLRLELDDVAVLCGPLPLVAYMEYRNLCSQQRRVDTIYPGDLPLDTKLLIMSGTRRDW